MRKYFVFIIFALFLLINDVSAVTEAPVDVTTMSIEELLDALDKGYLTSETLVSIYLERIEEYDDLFNSINQLNEHALEQARELDEERAAGNIKGRLHGIPILVKCNIDVHGMPTTAGTKSLLDNYPYDNATVVQKLIDEGAIILGSTNMSELAFSASNSYSSFGYVRNVFNVDYTPYGSSGGSAVAVRAAFAAAALGTDTNSSVRLPASGAGIVGIRPTLGLVSRSGVIPYDIERDTVGVLSRNVADSALLLSIISGSDENDEITIDAPSDTYSADDGDLDGITIGVITQYVEGSSSESGVTGETDSEILELLNTSISELEEAGATIIYLDDFVKSSNLSIATSTYAGITMCDYFNEYISGTSGSIRSFQQLANSSGHVQNLSGYVSGCGTSSKYKSERDSKKAIYREYVIDYFEEYDLDVVLYPTLKNKVFEYNKTGNISPGSSFGSVIGFPSITVPMGFISDGFSYGIEFLSLAYNEQVLYNVAASYESINGNTVETSPLTPNLYVIVDEVSELKDLYEDVLGANNDNAIVVEWLASVKSFFLNYNDYDDKASEALDLLQNYEEMNIDVVLEENDLNNSVLKCFLFFLMFVALVIILKNIIKCFS